MKLQEIFDNLNLEEKHFELKRQPIPVIEPGLYNTLGRKLFDHYRKHKVSEEDQREIESICFLLTSFVLQREGSPTKKGWFFKRKQSADRDQAKEQACN